MSLDRGRPLSKWEMMRSQTGQGLDVRCGGGNNEICQLAYVRVKGVQEDITKPGDLEGGVALTSNSLAFG